jgi:hypothetical protein
MLENEYTHEILFDAVTELNRHINRSDFETSYSRDARSQLLKLRDNMDDLRRQLDLERPVKSAAAIECTAYDPYLREELRPLELNFMRHYYPNLDTLIANAENRANENWQQYRFAWNPDGKLSPHAGLLSEAVHMAVVHCRVYAKFVSYWCGMQRIYMAGPSRLALSGDENCRLLWAIQTYDRRVTSDHFVIGLMLEGRELWVTVRMSDDGEETPFGVLLIRGEPIPAQWCGRPAIDDAEEIDRDAQEIEESKLEQLKHTFTDKRVETLLNSATLDNIAVAFEHAVRDTPRDIGALHDLAY